MKNMKQIVAHPLSRRSFLGIGAAGLAVLGAAGRTAAAADKKKIPVGLELYSVRNECAKDLPGVLAQVAKIGYKGVEFAGYHGRTAAELRKMLDANGLVCCGTHTPRNSIDAANLAATIEFNKTLGNKFLIVPSMALDSKAACLEQAKYFNEVADKVKAEGMAVGYHAHGHDFQKFDGETAWDLFFGNTKTEVIMQLDTSNAAGGGADPVAVLKKYANRARTIHCKEFGGPAGAVIGQGEIKWPEIFALCEANVTEWYVVEHESGTDPLGAVAGCYEGMRKFGKV
jgi:sugar phosphate isomerase/epimerase